jgi:hypothetical protein
VDETNFLAKYDDLTEENKVALFDIQDQILKRMDKMSKDEAAKTLENLESKYPTKIQSLRREFMGYKSQLQNFYRRTKIEQLYLSQPPEETKEEEEEELVEEKTDRTVEVDNEPFKIMNADNLTEKNRKKFDEFERKTRVEVQQMEILDVSDSIKRLRDRHPNKMGMMQRIYRDPETILYNYLVKDYLEDLFLSQEEEKEQETFSLDEMKAPNDELFVGKITDLNKDNFAVYNNYVNGLKDTIKSLTPEEIDAKMEEIKTKYPNNYELVKFFTTPTTQLRRFMQMQALNNLYTEQYRQVSRWGTDNPRIVERQEELTKKQKPELIAILTSYGIKGISNKNKEKLVERIIRYEEEENLSSTKTTGLGLKGLKGLKRRKIVGRGSSDDSETRKEFNGKFIDLRKLKDNILTIKYVKTGAYIPNVKSQHVSEDTKEVINDLINEKFDNRLFQKLPDTDRRLVKRVIKAFKLTVDDKDVSEEEHRKQYDIILGQFKSGNTSPLIKNKLRQYVVESMETGALTRREAWQILFELANA